MFFAAIVVMAGSESTPRTDGRLRQSASSLAAAPLRDYSAQVTGLSPWGGKAWNSSHHRGSADKVAEYYTPELAGLVFDIQREDFVNFGYPAWNGDKHTFRYVR